MDILQFLKSGSGIHIKKENRGKFTDYCGGKVTSECIAKGKRSSNPAIRKRATFAANARKWKHENGGIIRKMQTAAGGPLVLDLNEVYLKNKEDNARHLTIAENLVLEPTPTNLIKAAYHAYRGSQLGLPYSGKPEEFNLVNTGYLTVPSMRYVDLITREAPALKSLVNEASTITKSGFLSKNLDNMFRRFPDFKKSFRKFLRTGDKSLLQLLEEKAKLILNTPKKYIDVTSKGMTPGNDVVIGKVSQPLTGLTVREANPIMLENYVTNAAEKQAALDFMKANPNTYPGNIKLPSGRPSKAVLEEIMYPWKLKTAQLKVSPTLKVKTVKPSTPKLTQKERYLERKTFSKAERQRDKYARAYEYQDMRIANSGQSRMKRAQFLYDLLTLKSYPEYAKRADKIEKKLAIYEKGSFGHKLASKALKDLVEEWRSIYRRKLGGTLIRKAADGDTTLSWWQKNLGTINTIGSTIANEIPNIAGAILKRKKANRDIEANNLSNKISFKLKVLEKYLLKKANNITSPMMFNGEIINSNPDMENVFNYQQAYNEALAENAEKERLTELENREIDRAASLDITNSIMGTVGNAILTGIGLYNANKASTSYVPVGTTTTSYASYAPGYTPSMPKTFDEYVALNYKK